MRRAGRSAVRRVFRPCPETLELRHLPSTITALSVANAENFARVAEPVTSGVPLPETLGPLPDDQGLLDTSRLRILDSNNQPVPAQFRVLGRWNAAVDDVTHPIRWVEVHFAANVPAQSTATYTLDDGGSGNAPAGLEATQSADFIDVATGPARFQIDRTSFDLFHTVWLDLNGDKTFADDERMVIDDPGNGSFVARAGTEYRSSQEPPVSVTLEESGPLRAVVRAEGFHATGDGSSSLLRYVTYLTFFAGQSYVQVDQTLIEGHVIGNGGGALLDGQGQFTDNQQITDIDEAGLRVKLQLTGPIQSTVRAAADPRSATLDTGAAVVQHRLRDFTQPLSYDVVQNGSKVESGTAATSAWLDSSDGRWGLAVSTRDFVNKNPEALRAGTDGTVEVEFPAEPFTIIQAQGIGEQTVFYFHAGAAAPATLQPVLEGLAKDRLLAVAPTQWMLDSQALGVLPPATLPTSLRGFETYLTQSDTATMDLIASRHVSGLLHYLDLPADRQDSPPGNDADYSDWGNGVFDPGAAWIAQFARTGNLHWLKDLAFPFIQHWYTTDAYDTDAASSDQNGIGGAAGPFHRSQWTGDNHYLASLWSYYYLTGDRRALERGHAAALTYLHDSQPDDPYSLDYDDPTRTTTGASNLVFAQKFETLVEAYMATGDAGLKTDLDNQVSAYLQRRFSPEKFLYVGSEAPSDPYVPEQGSIANLVHNAIYKYFKLTGDDAARDFVTVLPQRLAQYQRVSQDSASPDYYRFYNKISVTRGSSAGQFTTAPVLSESPAATDYFDAGDVIGLGTALARSDDVSGDTAATLQARDIYLYLLKQNSDGSLARLTAGPWSSDVAKVTLRAFDGLGLLATDSPSNHPPTLLGIGAKAAIVGSPLEFTAGATDDDPGDQDHLAFSLDPGASGDPAYPTGAAIDPASGKFTWAPGTAGSYRVTVRVTDPAGASDSEPVDITVSAAPPPNHAPVLQPIDPQTVVQGQQLEFPTEADDPLDVNDMLQFSLGAGAPAGAEIDPSGGLFTWTPGPDQPAGVYQVTIIVTDNGTPAKSDSQLVDITVRQPPVLAALANQRVAEGATLSFTAQASAPGAGRLTFSLDAGAPTGAAIDASSGAFLWTPGSIQGGHTYNITVRVSDDGSPTLSDARTIQVVVDDVPAPAPKPTPTPTATGPEATSARLASSLTSAVAGQAVTFTMTIAGETGLPEGNVAFFDGSRKLGTAWLSEGSATLTTAALGIGRHTIKAVFDGDAGFQGVTAARTQPIVAMARQSDTRRPGKFVVALAAGPGKHQVHVWLRGGASFRVEIKSGKRVQVVSFSARNVSQIMIYGSAGDKVSADATVKIPVKLVPVKSPPS